MNARLIRATLAVAAILVASIVIGGMMVFVGAVMYRWLAAAISPGAALAVVIGSAVVLGGLIVGLGQIALHRALRWSPAPKSTSTTPDEMIAGELLRLVDGDPTKMVLASLGIGFALGLSPRLRRTVYRALTE